MRCAWQELIGILPPWLREKMQAYIREPPEEMRLRCDREVELRFRSKSLFLTRKVTSEDISFVVNAASRYSPWSSATIAHGYLTAPGGHRIGLCGESVLSGGELTGMRTVTSLCIRVAKEITGVSTPIAHNRGSLLIIGAPGSGKTTFLRDLIFERSERGEHIAVVDERGELYPIDAGFSEGKYTDVLRNCPKTIGVEMVLRTMGVETIALDEITADTDCKALLQALWCGVDLLATAHAASVSDLKNREIYRPLQNSGIFSNVVVMKRDKSWTYERMDI